MGGGISGRSRGDISPMRGKRVKGLTSKTGKSKAKGGETSRKETQSGDPENTYRDDAGRLRADEGHPEKRKGQFVKDPHSKRRRSGSNAGSGNRSKARRRAEKRIDDDHPLSFLLDDDGTLRSGRSRSLKDEDFPGDTRSDQDLGLPGRDRPAVEMGHMKSRRALEKGESEHLVLEDADLNAETGYGVESKGGYVVKGEGEAVMIEGVPVDKTTAKHWESQGYLPEGTVENAPSTRGWEYQR